MERRIGVGTRGHFSITQGDCTQICDVERANDSKEKDEYLASAVSGEEDDAWQ